MMRAIILALGLVSPSASALAQDAMLAPTETTDDSFADSLWDFVRPDYAYAQNGAYAGYAVAGIGYSLGRYLAWDLNYGYTPKSIGGHDIHSFSGKIFSYLAPIGPRHQWEIKPYLGLGFIYNPDSELFVRLPDQYPEWYYPPTAIRAGLHGGMELNLKEPGIGLFTEFVILDHEVAPVVNRGALKTRDVGSLGFGLRWEI